jgi:esterase
MLFALKNPLLVSNLVVVDIAPKFYEMKEMRQYIIWMKEIERNRLSKKEAYQFLKEYLPHDFSLCHFLLSNYVEQENLEYENKERTFHFRIPLEFIEYSLDHLQEFPSIDQKYNFPSLFIYGTRSSYLQEDKDAFSILEGFPLAKFLGIEAGHWLHVEQTEKFVKIVNDFFQHS